MASRTLVLLLALVAAPMAHADVYKCVDANGHITYTNDRSLARNCAVMSTESAVTSVPPPRAVQQQPTPSSFPRVSPDAQRGRDDTRRQILEAELEKETQALGEARAALEEEEGRDAPEDRNAPKRTTRVIKNADGTTRTVTDVGPRTINRAKTAERLKPFEDKVELHQRNIDALQREISGLR